MVVQGAAIGRGEVEGAVGFELLGPSGSVADVMVAGALEDAVRQLRCPGVVDADGAADLGVEQVSQADRQCDGLAVRLQLELVDRGSQTGQDALSYIRSIEHASEKATKTRSSRTVRAVTYSIVARDPETGSLGVAVQTHQPSVGALCPFAEPGVGAVATQSIVEPAYGPLGLEAMRGGESAPDALARLTSEDEQRELRQIAFVDAQGKVATHTGERCIAHAGHIVGDGFSCQANMMRDEGVPEAMASAFTASTGDLAHRILAALDAGQAAGGDIRGMQSAALIVVSPGARLDRRVDDHREPLVELRRLVDLDRDNPEGWFWEGIGLAYGGDVDAGRTLVERAYATGDHWRELLRRLPATGLVPDDPDVLDRLLR